MSAPVTIDNPDPITIISENVAHITCNGLNDGSIVIEATGGSGILNYTLTPGSLVNTNGIFNNLSSGTYLVSVSDENGCLPAISNSLDITEPDPIVINSGTASDISCFGFTDGQINLSASGGTMPLQYTLMPGSTSDPSGTFSNLSAGTYTISVTDASGCAGVISNPFTIDEPLPINLLSGTSVNISCNGADDGKIIVIGAGGTSPLNYTLNPNGINNISGTFNNLSEGSYTVIISDANSCPPLTSTPILVTDPPVISIGTLIQTDISCNGASDGEIRITAAGGTGTLIYTLSPGTISNSNGIFTGLAAGTYTISVTDINLCNPAVTAPVTISEPAGITATINPSSKLSLNCFGDNNGSINITLSGGTPPFIYNWSGPNGFSSGLKDISGLTTGTYNLNLTDARNCTANFPAFAVVTQPSEVQMSLGKTDVTCNGDANGSIIVTASGGTPPYTYSKNGINYFPSNVFSNLVQNTYRIYVKDSKNCTKSDTISIFEPEEFTVASEIRIDNNQCFGDSLGEIRILTVTGGTLPYEYSINGGLSFQSGPSFSFLPAGNYQTVVRDNAGCEAMGNNNLINQPPKIKITAYAQVDVTDCFGNMNGQIAIEATGGTGIKRYSLDGGTSFPTGIFNSVSGGNHTINISDFNSCTFDTLVTLNEPDEIIFDNLSITDVTGCTGNSNGEISVSVSGGTGLFQFSIDSQPFQGSMSFTNLPAGNHTISVMDENSCQKDTLVVVNEPAPVSIVTETILNASCAGTSDGEISITVSGGTLPYTFILSPGGETNNTGTFTGLLPGIYSVEVNDNVGCGPVVSNNLEVKEPEAMIIDSLNISPIICSGDGNAEIHVYASGGTVPYDFSIDDEVTWYRFSDFTGLPAGSYYLSMKDSNNCRMPIDTITFTDPDPLSVASENIGHVTSCFNDPGGSILYQLQGGVGNIEYSLDGGSTFQPTALFEDLMAGSYTIIARDERSCTKTSPEYSINQPSEISATISSTPERDNGDKGTITISNATGGTGILMFSVDGPAGIFGPDTLFTGLDAGFYEVVVRDENGCTFTKGVEVTKILPLEVTRSVENSSCFGLDNGSITLTALNPIGNAEYSIDGGSTWDGTGFFDMLSPGDYFVAARDEDGRVYNDTITLTEPEEIILFSIITPATCSSFSDDGSIDITASGAQGTVNYSWSNGSTTEDISGLATGEYTVSINDENDCSVSNTYEISALTTIEANAGADTSICAGTTFRLNGSGGTDLRWEPEEGLSNPLIYNPEVNISSDAEYILRAEGEGNCYDLDTIQITLFPNMGLSAGNDTSVFENQQVAIFTNGGPYVSYSWLPTNGVDDPSSANVVITPTRTTIYIVSATDENGCINTDSITISLLENMVIYNAFSPNDDGVNDYWDIDNAGLYPDITVEVFTRWGERVFSSVGYSDDKRWDGRYKGKNVPIGTYYFVVIPHNGGNAISGPLTIVR